MTNFEKRILNKQWLDEDEKQEWWHKSDGEIFVKLGRQLLEHGFTEQGALDFLGRAYCAVSGEYGE